SYRNCHTKAQDNLHICPSTLGLIICTHCAFLWLLFRGYASALKHFIESYTRDLLRLFTALVHDSIQLLIRDFPDALLEWSQKVDRRFCKFTFQLRVTFARKVIFNRCLSLSSDEV